MTYERTTDQDATEVDAPGEDQGFNLSLLWLWPILLLHAVFETYVAKLNAMRRQGLPKAWREAIPGLLESEWHIRSIAASGVEMLRSGKAFSLEGIEVVWDLPTDLLIPPPRSAWESHRRFEAIARFHADPETFVRRQARRIATAQARLVYGLEIDLLSLAATGTAADSPVPSSTETPVAERARAPPWLLLFIVENHRILAPQAPARRRTRVQAIAPLKSAQFQAFSAVENPLQSLSCGAQLG